MRLASLDEPPPTRLPVDDPQATEAICVVALDRLGEKACVTCAYERQPTLEATEFRFREPVWRTIGGEFYLLEAFFEGAQEGALSDGVELRDAIDADKQAGCERHPDCGLR
jgi:hypothetical protein